jgi:hypothetical protein
LTAILQSFTMWVPEGWPVSVTPRTAADVVARCPRGRPRGMSPRWRRRGPKGQRKAAGARRCTVPLAASQLRADIAPLPVSGRVARHYPVRWTAATRRAPRALEDVEKVLTDRLAHNCAGPLDA